METLNERMKGNDTVNVQWTQFGEEQKQVRKTFDPSPESIGCPGNGRQRLNEPESSGDASADLLESNHQLESRIQEIWPSGSEGGAKPIFVPTPIATPKEPSRRVRCDSRRCAHRFDDWSDEISSMKTQKLYVVLFLAYDTISFHGKHFLVPEHSLRFQHEGTSFGPES